MNAGVWGLRGGPPERLPFVVVGIRAYRYMEMPYYEHGQLDVWIQKQKPDILSILRVLTQLLLAVSHLHHKGIIHRDIKPANVLIGSDGCAYLADFDISIDATARASHVLLRATAAPVGGGTRAPPPEETNSQS